MNVERMDTDVIYFLQRNAEITIPSNVVIAIVTSVLYGMNLPVFVWSMRLNWMRGFRSPVLIATAGATLLCFTLITLDTATTISECQPVLTILLAFNQSGKPTIDEVIEASNRGMFVPDVIRSWSQNILVGLSDGIIIWRTSVIFPNYPWMFHLLALLWVAYVATVIALSVLCSSYKTWSEWQPRADSYSILKRLNEASNYLSLAVNLLATLLILHGLWRYRRSFFASSSFHKSTSQKILTVLVDTGLIFCCLQMITFVLQQLTDSGIIPLTLSSILAMNAFYCMVYAFSGVYPAIVGVLVQSQRQENLVYSSF